MDAPRVLFKPKPRRFFACCVDLHELHLARRIWGFQGKSVASGAARNTKPASSPHQLHPTRHNHALSGETVASGAVGAKNPTVATATTQEQDTDRQQSFTCTVLGPTRTTPSATNLGFSGQKCRIRCSPCAQSTPITAPTTPHATQPRTIRRNRRVRCSPEHTKWSAHQPSIRQSVAGRPRSSCLLCRTSAFDHGKH